MRHEKSCTTVLTKFVAVKPIWARWCRQMQQFSQLSSAWFWLFLSRSKPFYHYWSYTIGFCSLESVLPTAPKTSTRSRTVKWLGAGSSSPVYRATMDVQNKNAPVCIASDRDSSLSSNILIWSWLSVWDVAAIVTKPSAWSRGRQSPRWTGRMRRTRLRMDTRSRAPQTADSPFKKRVAHCDVNYTHTQIYKCIRQGHKHHNFRYWSLSRAWLHTE